MALKKKHTLLIEEKRSAEALWKEEYFVSYQYRNLQKLLFTSKIDKK